MSIRDGHNSEISYTARRTEGNVGVADNENEFATATGATTQKSEISYDEISDEMTNGERVSCACADGKSEG